MYDNLGNSLVSALQASTGWVRPFRVSGNSVMVVWDGTSEKSDFYIKLSYVGVVFNPTSKVRAEKAPYRRRRPTTTNPSIVSCSSLRRSSLSLSLSLFLSLSLSVSLSLSLSLSRRRERV